MKDVADGSTLSEAPSKYRMFECGHVEVVKTLLAAEAEVNKSDNWGWTPLRISIFHSHPEVAAVLREAGGHE